MNTFDWLMFMAAVASAVAAVSAVYWCRRWQRAVNTELHHVAGDLLEITRQAVERAYPGSTS